MAGYDEKISNAKDADQNSVGKQITRKLNEGWEFIQDLGYGVANIWGQGETANNLINKIKLLFSQGYDNPKQVTKRASELIQYIYKELGGDWVKMNKILNLIDAKLGNLPPALSDVARQAIGKARQKLLEQRNKIAPTLSKVEQTINSSISAASNQDLVAPSVKIANQQSVIKSVDTAKKNYSDINLDEVERKI